MTANFDPMPKDNREYAKKTYWDNRFLHEESYDWLAKFENIQNLLEEHVAKESRILMIGCGSSTLSADMYNCGYKNIINIDFSPVVIENMRELHKDKQEMLWITADMLSLHDSFNSQSFDVVIDKAAMDAIMCDEGDVWSPSTHVIESAQKICTGITSVLKDTGIFIQISFGQPHFRKRYLVGEKSKNDPERWSDDYKWIWSYKKIDVGLGYFFYIMQKGTHSEA